MEKVIVKNVILNENYDLMIEVYSKDKDQNIKWLMKKNDFNFNGMPIQESMIKLKKAWSLHLNKEINVNFINSDKVEYDKNQSSIEEEVLDPSIRRQFLDIEYDDDDFGFDLQEILKDNQNKFQKNIKRLNELFQKIEEKFDEKIEKNDIVNKDKNLKFFF